MNIHTCSHTRTFCGYARFTKAVYKTSSTLHYSSHVLEAPRKFESLNFKLKIHRDRALSGFDTWDATLFNYLSSLFSQISLATSGVCAEQSVCPRWCVEPDLNDFLAAPSVSPQLKAWDAAVYSASRATRAEVAREHRVTKDLLLPPARRYSSL